MFPADPHVCGASGGTVAAGDGETCPEDLWAMRDLFHTNPFHEVIFLKGKFSLYILIMEVTEVQNILMPLLKVCGKFVADLGLKLMFSLSLVLNLVSHRLNRIFLTQFCLAGSSKNYELLTHSYDVFCSLLW